jgi:hypothetical protein
MSAMMTARYDTALTAKHGVVPTVAINAPATAGPTTRALFMTTIARRHEGADERLPGGGVHDLDEPADNADGDDKTDGCLAGDRARPQRRGQQPERQLGAEQQLAQVEPVSDRAAPWTEEKRRHSTGGEHQAERRRRAGDAINQPGDRRLLQERTAGRSDLAKEVDPERPRSQRPEGAAILVSRSGGFEI